MLSKNLLFTEEEFELNSSLNGTNVKRSYSTMQFVLRLRDDIRKALDEDELEYEKIQASSTTIHENIHWWQHVGSNFGFIFSLAYPAFCHVSKENLESIVNQGLLIKSILKFDNDYYQKTGKADIADINVILNTYHDLEYAKSFALDNANIKKILEDKRFFLNIGHCYHILWSSTVHTIATTLDPDYCFLPKIDNWAKVFRQMTKDEVPGFYIDSDVHISPLGIKAIYEGQALFNQLQYLTVAINRNLKYSDFENIGMLHGIYTEAFELYLTITSLERPTNLLDPIIGLFLLVCDLAINPTNGFPIDIYDYKGFITKNDPGIRFTLFCEEISKDPLNYVSSVQSYSKQEYVYLSKILSEKTGNKCPYEGILTVLDWSKEEEVNEILMEEKVLNFQNKNLPIRLMFSKYFRFQEDKYEHPNVFCWFGFHSTSENPNIEFDIVNKLYLKHHALFTDDYDEEIKPTIFEGVEEKNIMESFNNFYNYNILYDLILRWVYEEGEFKYDYKWLANERSDSFIPHVKDSFYQHFGVSIDDLKII